jgi:uncharacterized membrane protein YfcA
MDSFILLKFLGGLILGIIVGSIGAGGSLLAIPILEDMFHVSALKASILSLLVVSSVSFVGLVLNYKSFKGWMFHRGLHMTIFYGACGSLTAHFFSKFGLSLSLSYRSLFFAILLNLACLLMILNAIYLDKPAQNKKLDFKGFRLFGYLLINSIFAVLLGMVTGIFGVGGGFLLVPIILWIAKLNFNYAVICSLAITTINSLSGLSATFGLLTYDEILKAVVLSLFGVVGIVLSYTFKKYYINKDRHEIFEKWSKVCYSGIIFLLSLRYYFIFLNHLELIPLYIKTFIVNVKSFFLTSLF